MIVHVHVHPIDTDRFPSVPPGYRWCVSLTENPSDPSGWLNAGWEPTAAAAELEGATVAVTVARGLTAVGHQSRHVVQHFVADPCGPDLIRF